MGVNDRSLVLADAAPSTRVLEGLAVVATVLVGPALLYLANLAPYGRVLYPVTNVLLAAYLLARKSPWYVGHCVLLFCFVSLVRRLVDEQAGWDPSNPVLLTPYLCCLFAIIGFFNYWSQRQPRYLGPFLCLLFCIAYGVVLAMLHGRMLAALVDALKWSIEPIFAVYVLSQWRNHVEMRKVVELCLVWAGAFMGAYGILQYIDPPSWDIEWMRGVAQLGLDSIGRPEPFSLRVFSTMNSPGSLGTILCVAIVLLLKQRAPIIVLTLPLMIGGLALCQYRSIWASTALAVLMIVLSRGANLRPANLLALIGVVFLLCSTAVVPRIHEAVAQRATSLTSLKNDESLESRLEQYAGLGRNRDLILGEGLAINGASRRLDKELPKAIDGAFIEIPRAMGVIVGALFLLSLGGLIGSLFFVSPSAGHQIFYDRAIVAATFIQMPMGSVHTGELGFCAWMFLGFGLATRVNA